MKEFYVYILASKRNGTLYVGSTSNIIQRIWEHKNNVIPESFTARYNIHTLVYYEIHQSIDEMVRRERRFKNWPRKWKLNIIEKLNPTWRDLYFDVCEAFSLDGAD